VIANHRRGVGRGALYISVDTRKANEAIVRQRHSINIGDDESTVFGKLDSKWAFHRIELEQEPGWNNNPYNPELSLRLLLTRGCTGTNV